MSDTLIKVSGLSKKFCRSLKRSMYYGMVDSIRTMLGIPYDHMNVRKSEFLALENINFELNRGETLGVIGINGAGKSTLLRLLTGIFPPDFGKIEIKGRIGSLIAVGVGFHPHMTGRENIYLNGTLLGMKKKEIAEKFEEIVDFAEIKESLDAPVATYSSGMKVRLGFAIAIHCEPDIMLIDEVLSVGDIGFKNKSLRKIYEYKEKANGVIFISHDMEQVRTLCDRLIVMDKGKIVYEGDTYKGLIFYEDQVRQEKLKRINNSNIKKQLLEIDKQFGMKQSAENIVEYLEMGVLNRNCAKDDSITTEDILNLYCDFKVKKPIKSLYFSVGVLEENYKPLIWVMSNDGGKEKFEKFDVETYRLVVQIPEHHLVPGLYIPAIAIRNEETGETYEKAWPKSTFQIQSNGKQISRGKIDVKENWILYSNILNSKSDEVFNIITPGDIAIDCGANIGDITSKLVEKGAKVFAFEPNPYAFDKLSNRFKMNQNIECINKGVWDKNSTMPLFLHYENEKDPIGHSISSSILVNKRNVDKDNFVDVELIDLQDFIVKLNKKIKILKLDVEGAEIEILHKLIDTNTIKQIEQILVETHEKQMPELVVPMKELKQKIKKYNITNINLNWV